MKKLAFIDALRGYAVLGVLLVHTGQEAGFPGAPFSAGARGVQLFFVVSALTLLMSWHNRDDGAGAFFVRRAFRILPMFWLSIPLYLTGPIDGQIVAAALLLQAIRPDWIFAPIVPGGWSVCAEAGFYLCFPILARHVTTLRRAIYFVVATVIIARIWRAAGMQFMPTIFPDASRDELWVFVAFTFPAQLPAFASGIACYFLIPVLARLDRRSLETLLIASIIGVVWLAFYREDIAIFAGLFAIGTACMANGAGRYLVNGAIAHIGRCSFSIYLLQWLAIGHSRPLVDQFDGGPKFAALFVCSVALATAGATVTYYLVERPMIRFGNVFLSRRAVPEVAAGAPSG